MPAYHDGPSLNPESQVLFPVFGIVLDQKKPLDSPQSTTYIKRMYDCKLGDGCTSDALAEEFRAAYRQTESHIFWKWVTDARMSPGWGGASILHYAQGFIIEEPSAVESDQQCAAGLHVFRLGYRPEYDGYDGTGLICLRVRVLSEDIMFAGLPGWDAKLRVRKLEVLD